VEDLDPVVLQTQMAEMQSIASAEEIHNFGDQPEAVTLYGLLLYPRTFGSNGGLMSTTPWQAYLPRDYPRLGFRVLNQDLRDIVFPNRGVSVENVQGYDVILLGCERENYIEARLLVFPNENLTYLSDLELAPCS